MSVLYGSQNTLSVLYGSQNTLSVLYESQNTLSVLYGSQNRQQLLLYIINWLVFITVVKSVCSAVRTDSLYKADDVSSLNVKRGVPRISRQDSDRYVAAVRHILHLYIETRSSPGWRMVYSLWHYWFREITGDWRWQSYGEHGLRVQNEFLNHTESEFQDNHCQ
jgi:hypothetical protein